MENNLSKAISQIKFPVRYDEITWNILDAEGKIVLMLSVYVKDRIALGHALSEMINGLDAKVDKNYVKKLSDEFYDMMLRTNPTGGIKAYLRMAIEYGIKNARLNGLDGRGNLQDLEKLRSIIEYCYGALFNVDGFGPYIKTVQEHLLQAKEIMSMLSIDSKPDRQVKSAEEIMSKYKKEYGSFFFQKDVYEAMEIYAQQVQGNK